MTPQIVIEGVGRAIEQFVAKNNRQPGMVFIHPTAMVLLLEHPDLAPFGGDDSPPTSLEVDGVPVVANDALDCADVVAFGPPPFDFLKPAPLGEQ